MKKIVTLLFISLFSFSVFAQTKVDAKKIGKTLESNKESTAVFTCDMSLSGMKVSNDGLVSLPALSKNKVKIVFEMDMTNITERVAYANKKTYLVTFATVDIDAKKYSIVEIEGIETVAEYKERRFEEQKAEARKNITKFPVQVVNQEVVNISGAEAAWLPGQIQDKLKSNLQEYLGMKTVVDSKSELALKKLQAESENAARDESTAIELGKITTAKFAVFTKLRKTGSGYTISIDFTDLTTGEQMASCSSKEYSKAEYLYGSTGAVDELTLALGNKLGINISDLNKNLLASGSSSFSVDAQLALAKQNEEQYQKMMRNYDDELSKLMTSNDINAIQNKNRIEAEKALLVEKQNAEKKRQEELQAQMARAAEDEKLEAERSIALKTQRDQMAKDAAAKAAEVRKLKMEKQGVLGQINVIESKKKALVEIRQGVESRHQELYDQLEKDRESEESRIRNKSYSTVELGSDGKPTEQAKQRRENQVIKSYEDLTNKFFADCDAVKKATASQDTALLAEIRADQKTLATTRTVSSMGEELKVSYGKYEGSKNGWNAYLSLYSDGILLYTDNFIVNYEALSGKKAPNMETELDDAVIEEYTNNVDMYNSLLTRGDPIIYFEIDYNVTAESDDKPSQYKFNFSKIRVINTVSGKVTQTSALNKMQPRTMKPEWDVREISGIVAKEKGDFDELYNYFLKGFTLENTKKGINAKKFLSTKMLNIPGQNFLMLNTEVTQELYTFIMGYNPSYNKGENNPVEQVSWGDAVYFCNKLSELCGFIPVYSVKGVSNPERWEYIPHTHKRLTDVTQDPNADGFRLPTRKEWKYAARGGQSYIYSGSDNFDEVAWTDENSKKMSHPVAQKKANAYGLYDMSGNVNEWCWDDSNGNSNYRFHIGGSYGSFNKYSKISENGSWDDLYYTSDYIGFRIVCSEKINFGNISYIDKISVDISSKKSVLNIIKRDMVLIPGQKIKMLRTEVTQGLYEAVMGCNPSHYRGDNNPVEMVSWYDAIYFSNMLSEKFGYTPVYSVKGTTNVSKWNYTPHHYNSIRGKITQNTNANGFRLPTEAEWEYAAGGGQNYIYSGSNNLDEVGWYESNSGGKTLPAAQKKANGYGLYDMSGNVREWCWDDITYLRDSHNSCGGCYFFNDDNCKVSDKHSEPASSRNNSLGFRIVRSTLD